MAFVEVTLGESGKQFSFHPLYPLSYQPVTEELASWGRPEPYKAAGEPSSLQCKMLLLEGPLETPHWAFAPA